MYKLFPSRQFARKHAIKFPSEEFALALGLARPAPICRAECLGGNRSLVSLRSKEFGCRESSGSEPLERVDRGSVRQIGAGHYARSACETVFLANCLPKKSGQSLIEVLIAVAVGALIVGSAAGALIFTVRSNQQSHATDTASTLAQELLDQVRSVSESNWQNLYNLSAKGGPTQSCPPYCYYLDASLNIVAGSEQKVVNNITYTRSFAVENVNRDNCGTKDITSAGQAPCSPSQTGVLDDPSTQKITAKVTWPQGGDMAEVLVSEYLTRSKNEINQFTDWSGSSGVAGSVVRPSKDYFDQSGLDTATSPGSIKLTADSGWLESSTFNTGYADGVAFNSLMWKGELGTVGNAVKFQFASSNSESATSEGSPTGPIDSTDRYAWNDIIGWLDFYGASGGPSAVTTAKMTRWAVSSGGEFALDCVTTPSGDVCATSNFYVSNNNGNLAGWAWNDAYGWVSFCGNATENSTWDGSTWVCPASPTYQVNIDAATGDFAGWAWNDIIGWVSFCGDTTTGSSWNGSAWVCPASPTYKVKVAGAGSGWNYIGPDGSYSSFYTTTGSGAPVPIVTAHHNNKQYYRYKVYLAGDATLIVDDIIVNWSP